MHNYDPRETLLLATHNVAKFAEIKQLLADVPCAVVSLDDISIHYDVQETGTTFEENAILKARTYAQLSGLITLADDSGLVVNALGGEPGIYTNRYAGEHASDEQKCQYLLEKMKKIPIGKRQAHFAIIIALAYPSGDIHLYEGYLHGQIVTECRGKLIPKFPYRSIFELPEYNKTLAELLEQGVSLENISPRQEVIAKVKKELLDFYS